MRISGILMTVAAILLVLVGSGAMFVSIQNKAGEPVTKKLSSFNGVVKSINRDGSFLIAEPKNPQDPTTWINIASVITSEYTEVIKRAPLSLWGWEKVSLQQMRQSQRVNIQGFLDGYDEKNSISLFQATKISIQQENAFQYLEKTRGLTTEIISASSEYITLIPGITVRILPDTQPITHDSSGNTVPFEGTLDTGTRITLRISTRPDINGEYTNYIFVH